MIKKLIAAIFCLFAFSTYADPYINQGEWKITLTQRPCQLYQMIPPQYINLPDWKMAVVTHVPTGQNFAACYSNSFPEVVWDEPKGQFIFLFDQTGDAGMLATKDIKDLA